MPDGTRMAPADPRGDDALKRKQRARNIALLVVLLALVVLFYAMTIAKMSKGVP
jgi:hypothetical protein